MNCGRIKFRRGDLTSSVSSTYNFCFLLQVAKVVTKSSNLLDKNFACYNATKQIPKKAKNSHASLSGAADDAQVRSNLTKRLAVGFDILFHILIILINNITIGGLLYVKAKAMPKSRCSRASIP